MQGRWLQKFDVLMVVQSFWGVFSSIKRQVPPLCCSPSLNAVLSSIASTSVIFGSLPSRSAAV